MFNNALRATILAAATMVSNCLAWDQVIIKILDPHNKPIPNAKVSLNGIFFRAKKINSMDSQKSFEKQTTDSAGNITIEPFDGYSSPLNAAKVFPFSIKYIEVSVSFDATDPNVPGYARTSSTGDASKITLTQLIQIDSTDSNFNDYDVGQKTTLHLSRVFGYDWKPSPEEKDSGFFYFTGVPYQILYDPPGDASSANLTKSSTYTTSITTSFGTNAGGSLSFGYEYENSLTGNGGSVDLTAKVNYTHNKENNFTVSATNSSSLTTSSQSDASEVGPGRGDMYVCPSLKMKWHLYRALAPKDSSAYKDGYVYQLRYAPVPDPANTQLIIPASQLASTISDANNLRQILAASAIDPLTRRIRSSLLDRTTGKPIGDRLAKVGGATVFSGGGQALTNSSDSSSTTSVTISQSLDASLEATVKAKICGVTAGASISAGLTIGGQQGGSASWTRSVSYTIQDANPWDRLHYNTYLDRTFGVYVFEVDSSDSWTSYPSQEDGYSSPTVALGISTDTRDTLTLMTGKTDTFTVKVSNKSRSNIPQLDTIYDVTATVKSVPGVTISANPDLWDLSRKDTLEFKVYASAGQPGVYPIKLTLSGVTALTPYSQVVPLTLVAREPSSNTSPAFPASKGRLVNQGTGIRVECHPHDSWSLRIRSPQGRTIMETEGFGPRFVPLPRSKGISLQDFVINGNRTSQILSNIH